MKNRMVAGAFLATSLMTARLGAQVLGAAGDLPLALRENLAPMPYLAVAALEGPGSEIGATVRNPRPDEGATPTLGHSVVVESVAQNSPAARADLKTGDVITFYMYGTFIDQTTAFRRLVEDTPPGRVLTLVVIRNGRQMTITLIPVLGRAGSSQWQ